MATAAFERVAEVVTERASEVLGAEVSVVDERGVIVTSSNTTMQGRIVDVECPPEDELALPLRLHGQDVQVLVSHPWEGDAVPPRLARVLIDLIVNQTAVVDRLPNKGELKNKLIHDLLHGSIADETETIREAQILGMDLSVPRTVILIDASDYILPAGHAAGQEEERNSRAMRRAQLVIGSVVEFFELPNDGICAYIGNGEVAVLKASNRQSLRRWVKEPERHEALNPSWASLSAVKGASAALLSRLRGITHSNVNIGIGRYHPGLFGLARSYQDAQASLSLGKRYGGLNHVYCLDSLGVAAFVGVSDESTKIDLAHYLLRPLDHEPELMRTLITFFDHNLAPSPASRELSIHRNTLSYRLDKITSLVGLDPRKFDDAVQLRLSLVLRSLGSSASDTHGNTDPLST